MIDHHTLTKISLWWHLSMCITMIILLENSIGNVYRILWIIWVSGTFILMAFNLINKYKITKELKSGKIIDARIIYKGDIFDEIFFVWFIREMTLDKKPLLYCQLRQPSYFNGENNWAIGIEATIDEFKSLAERITLIEFAGYPYETEAIYANLIHIEKKKYNCVGDELISEFDPSNGKFAEFEIELFKLQNPEGRVVL